MLRVSDFVSGLVVAIVGLAIFLRAQSFPSVGGVAIAPSFYPGLLGAVLMLLGAALAVSAVLRGQILPIIAPIDWLRQPATVVAVLSVPAAIICFGLLSPMLGFIATAFLITTGLLLAFRVSLATSLIVALCLTLVLYLVFVRMLNVPLPAGLIEGMLS